MERIERVAEPVQRLERHLRVSAESNAEMIRPLKKSAGNHRSLVVLAQKTVEPIHIAGDQARENRGAHAGLHHLQILAWGKQRTKRSVVGVENGASTRFYAVHRVKGDH